VRRSDFTLPVSPGRSITAYSFTLKIQFPIPIFQGNNSQSERQMQVLHGPQSVLSTPHLPRITVIGGELRLSVAKTPRAQQFRELWIGANG